MNRQKLLLTTFILLAPIISFSQAKGVNVYLVDSLVKTIKYKKDLFSLTKDLTGNYSEQVYIARAIFKWITENIKYDYKYYNRYYYKGKEPKTYKCKDNEDCAAKRIVWETKYIKKVLRKRKAVCQGYSMLFKKMCDFAGLKSEIVTGYVRTEYYQVGTAGTLDHVWNAVWIDSAYYLLDATWASGGCSKNGDGKLLSFHKRYNKYYWLTEPADFARNHFPEKNKWTLLHNYTKDSFSLNPYYASDEIDNIRLIQPVTGVVNSKKGDTIHFKIDYGGNIKNLQINSNIFQNPPLWDFEDPTIRNAVLKIDTIAQKKQQYVKYKQDGTLLEFDYVVSDNSLYYLDIMFDRRRVMRFKVVTNK
jgi:hypothetical protein